MTIINIRGTSGSGKSTLVKRFLDEHPHEPIEAILGPWKKPKTIAYKCEPDYKVQIPSDEYGIFKEVFVGKPTYIIGRYDTQCGGCDALSYRGSHNDIEEMVRLGLEKGNVIFEGLTISSTISRWARISQEHPGEFIWAFMATPVEECYYRILNRNGGREPKRDHKGMADYQRKFYGCKKQMETLSQAGERVVELTSDDAGYEKLLELLHD